jgi:hypothetical protein
MKIVIVMQFMIQFLKVVATTSKVSDGTILKLTTRRLPALPSSVHLHHAGPKMVMTGQETLLQPLAQLQFFTPPKTLLSSSRIEI